MQEEKNLTFRERFPRPKAPICFKHEFETEDVDIQLCENMDNLLDEEYNNSSQEEEEEEDEDNEGDTDSDDDSNSENDMDDS